MIGVLNEILDRVRLFVKNVDEGYKSSYCDCEHCVDNFEVGRRSGYEEGFKECRELITSLITDMKKELENG